MAENKTTPKDNIKLLQSYKGEKFASLVQSISQERNRALVLKNSIKAKIVQLNEIIFEQERALEQAEAEKAKASKTAIKETKVEETKVEIVAPEVLPVVPVVEEQTEPSTAPVEKKEEKVDDQPKKVQKEEKQQAKKDEKPEKTSQPKKTSQPVEIERVATGKPNVWLIKYSDGSQREQYIPPEKPKKTETRVFPGGYDTRAPKTGRPLGQNVQQGTQKPSNNARPNQQVGQNNVSLQNAAQQFPPKQNQQRGKGGKTNDGSKKLTETGASKYQLMKRGYIVDETRAMTDDEDFKWRGHKSGNKQKGQSAQNAIVIDHAVITTDPVPIKVLSEKIGKTGAEIISTLFLLGIIKNINGSIDFETAELVTAEISKDHPITLEYRPETTHEDELAAIREKQAAQGGLVTRPPVVCIMGHVDHGKTSLLDYIRKSNVTGGEAGGITQHIGAYTISLKGSPITFLDTPGHEAFTTMRARGAQATDIAILVVAADDGIMPQTIEAINHARQANVPIIVACNKIDKVSANPDRVLNQLTEHGLLPEEWGGETPVVRVSAKTGEGIESLLENVLILAEIRELMANPNIKARGTIIEARMDKGLGKIATVLVQSGTLCCGDDMIAGTATGRVKVMIDDKGKQVKKAGPSIPVSVTGWDELPEAGDIMDVVESDRFARELADERKLKLAKKDESNESVNLDDLFDKISKGELKTVKLIIKADVQGSLEAVKQSLGKLGNEEVNIEIIHGGVGAINESDVSLADTAKAIIIGFNVRPDANAKSLAAQRKIDIRFYNIIYKAIEDIEAAVKGMLAPKYKEVVLGSADVREIFKISGVGTIAGCHCTDGKILRNARARLIRNGKVEADTEIASLRHGKDDVKEIARNYDCGIMLLNYPDVKVDDVIEAYQLEQI
jgi:translation initiation factor IF-2